MPTDVRPRLSKDAFALAEARAAALGVSADDYLAALILAEADRLSGPSVGSWADVTRQLDRLASAVAMLAAVQSELVLELEALTDSDYEAVRQIALEADRLFAEVEP